MSSPFASLNLRPQERRLVVLVGIVLFVVLHFWLVQPHFNDWWLTQIQRDKARRTLDTYNGEIAKTKAYQVKLRELESAGSSVLPEEQELDLVRAVDNQARAHNLGIIQSVPVNFTASQTNKFFEEHYQSLHVTSGADELINFLVSLTSSNSPIRVKDLKLQLADASGTRLDGAMTLVASYKRSTPARATPSPNVPAPTRTPATASTSKTPKTAEAHPVKTNPSNTTHRVSIPSRTRLTNHPAKKP